MSSNIWKQITNMRIDIEILFQQPLHMEYVSLSWSDIPDLLVPIMISLIEGCCYTNYNINISVYFYDIYDMFFLFKRNILIFIWRSFELQYLFSILFCCWGALKYFRELCFGLFDLLFSEVFALFWF